MNGLYAIEIEPEVRFWLAGLSDRDFGRVDFLVGLLAEQAETLAEPYTRHLGGKVRELRFHLLARQTRGHLLAGAGPSRHPADRIPQDAQRRDRRSQPRPASPEDLRGRARASTRHV
jgi:hypothetical protein